MSRLRGDDTSKSETARWPRRANHLCVCTGVEAPCGRRAVLLWYSCTLCWHQLVAQHRHSVTPWQTTQTSTARRQCALQTASGTAPRRCALLSIVSARARCPTRDRGAAIPRIPRNDTLPRPPRPRVTDLRCTRPSATRCASLHRPTRTAPSPARVDNPSTIQTIAAPVSPYRVTS